MLGKIIHHDGNKLVIEFDEDINAKYLDLVSRGKENLVNVDILDNEPRSAKQNSLAHALIKDIGKHEAMLLPEAKLHLKELYAEGYGYEFKHSESSMSEMKKWIEFLIDYVLREGVKLPRRYNYLLEHDYFFYAACKYRKCCVCGKGQAHMHHVYAVGNRGRNNADHRNFPFASLCWVHHNIGHDIGVDALLKDYQIIPVLLDADALIKIGIMSNAQILRFDEKYETEELYQKSVKEAGGINESCI